MGLARKSMATHSFGLCRTFHGEDVPAANLGKRAIAIELMKETRSGRMSWIKESKPQVPVILSEFRYLCNNKIVSDSAVKHEQLYCIGHGKLWVFLMRFIMWFFATLFRL